MRCSTVPINIFAGKWLTTILTNGGVQNVVEHGVPSMSGKGDKRRPEDRAKIAANWDKIFQSGKENARDPKKEKTNRSDHGSQKRLQP